MAFFLHSLRLNWHSNTVVWELLILFSSCCNVTLYVFAYFVGAIISKSIGTQPAVISKALDTVRILGRNKTKSSLVNLITTFLFSCYYHRVSVKLLHSGFTTNTEGFKPN